MSITQELTDLIREVVEDLGYELVDLKYAKKGSDWLLQIFADAKGGINIKDCEKISKQVGYEMDRNPDLLKHSYNLEVSSPGLDRPLKTENDFNRYTGEEVNIRLYDPVNDRRSWKGKIIQAKDKELVIGIDEIDEMTLNIDNIAKAKLEVKI